MGAPSRVRRGWKAAERRVAAALGGQRVPITGRARGDVPDVAHERLSVEVKSRGSLPRWLCEALEQAEAAAAGGRVPVAILHRTGDRYDRALAVLRLSDLVALLGAGGRRAN